MMDPLTCEAAMYDMVSMNSLYPVELHLEVQVGPETNKKGGW